MSEPNMSDNPEVTSFQIGDYIIDIPNDLQDKILINDLFQESGNMQSDDCDSWGNSTAQSNCCNVTCKNKFYFPFDYITISLCLILTFYKVSFYI
jgi:hypothetical protein